MTSVQSFLDIKGTGITFLASPLVENALMFAKKHCDESIYNHVVRSAFWALIISKKSSETMELAADVELVVIACILHDMGLASSETNKLRGLSLDKRFEVDGANIAREFILSHAGTEGRWDTSKLDRLWTAIALHTTPSIALHAAPEVALANMAIMADFAGPYWSSDGEERLITVEEYRTITEAFPRGAFNRNGLKKTLCGLCQKKPETTYDNFVGLFGRDFGYDGEGMGRKEYAHAWEENQVTNSLLRGLDALDELDTSSSEQAHA